jgi:hypothetical protein
VFLSTQHDAAGARNALAEAVHMDEKAFRPAALQTLAEVGALATVSPASPAGPLWLRAAASSEPELAASSKDGARVAVRLQVLARIVGPPEGIGTPERVLAINRERLGARHPQTASVEAARTGLLLSVPRADEAERYSREAIAIFEENLGPDDAHVAIAATVLARALRAKGGLAEAEQMYRRALHSVEWSYGRGHRRTKRDLRALTAFLREVGNGSEA